MTNKNPTDIAKPSEEEQNPSESRIRFLLLPEKTFVLFLFPYPQFRWVDGEILARMFDKLANIPVFMEWEKPSGIRFVLPLPKSTEPKETINTLKILLFFLDYPWKPEESTLNEKSDTPSKEDDTEEKTDFDETVTEVRDWIRKLVRDVDERRYTVRIITKEEETMMNLTETMYLHFLTCRKHAYLEMEKPELAKAFPPNQFARESAQLKRLARDFFHATAVPYGTPKEMTEKTRKLLTSSDAISQASFQMDSLFCTVDILRKSEDGYDLIKVGSGKTAEKGPESLPQRLAFQYHVLTKAGIPVGRVLLVHPDSNYIRNGNLDLERFFALQDVTENVISLQKETEESLLAFQAFLVASDKDVPNRGSWCQTDPGCPFFDCCYPNLPSPSVLDIRRLQDKYRLYGEGIVTYEDVFRSNTILTEKQKIQVSCGIKNQSYFDNESIKKFLAGITYPVYHLDFETINPAVPLYDNTHPYQIIPVQYSLHIEQDDGSLEHREFLGDPDISPLRAISESLVKDIPDNVSVLAYHASFEGARLKELAGMFPDLKDHLLAIADHLIDLEEPFREMYCYDPRMLGSSSIKHVLPALYPNDPSLDYHSLEGVHNGTEAIDAYLSMRGKPKSEVLKTRKQLLEYCKLDTFAEVKVLDYLRKHCI